MLNKNAFKMIFLFMGLILIGVAVDFFMSRGAINFPETSNNIVANVRQNSWFFKK